MEKATHQSEKGQPKLALEEALKIIKQLPQPSYVVVKRPAAATLPDASLGDGREARKRFRGKQHDVPPIPLSWGASMSMISITIEAPWNRDRPSSMQVPANARHSVAGKVPKAKGSWLRQWL